MMESFNFMDVLFYGIALFEGYKFAFRKVSNHMVAELNKRVIDGRPGHQKLRMPLTIASILIISFFGFKIISGVSGMKTFYYESGAKMSEGKMSHSKENGHWVYYYENGNKQVEATFAKGIMDGEWKWKRRRPKGRFKNVVKADMQTMYMTEDAEDSRWKQIIHCGSF